MVDMIKNLGWKWIFKIFGVGVLALAFLWLAAGVLSAVFSWIGRNVSMNTGYSRYSSSDSVSNSLMGSSSSSFGGMAKMAAPQSEEYAKDESSPAPQEAAVAMEIKSYDAVVRTSDAKSSCDAFLSKIDRTWTTVENVNSWRSYCSFSVLVKKEKEEAFIASLREAGLYDLQTRVSNIRKGYAAVTDRTAELKKRLEETDALLASTKTQYDQLWEALKTKNVSAESIDALNRIITNKSDLISRFSRERLSIMTEIDANEKQKKDYEERLANIEFSVRFEKRVIVDWEQVGEAWSADFRELASVANETVRNLTVNLGSFLLKAVNVVIYLVLGAFIALAGGKFLYRMGRRILFGKEEKKEKVGK